MPYPTFDRSRILLKPMADRIHDLTLDVMFFPGDAVPVFKNPDLPVIAERIVKAYQSGRPVILLMGAHVIRRGMAPLIIDLMQRGIISHIALNGAGAIHDFEFAMVGATTENVSQYISEGQFGLWQETGLINDAVINGQEEQIGFGEAVGRMIEDEVFPHRDISILACGYKLGIPVTVHVCIGQDIVHEHPNLDGAALGVTSYQDFLVFAETIRNLEGGVLLNIGSAVMGPEVYLKALAMARNVAHQEGKSIKHFTTAVFDLFDLGPHLRDEVPKNSPAYYFRPYKTILVRTIKDGGESFYIRGDHQVTIPNLYHQVLRILKER